MIHPQMIADAVAPMLKDPSLGCINLVAPIRSIEEVQDPNTIKVVMARNGDALFFSRQPIPTPRNQEFKPGKWFKQVCVIPFRRKTLERFAMLPPTELELAESIDMLRLLEHGFPVRMVRTDMDTHAVDTLEDLRLVETLLARDRYTTTYMEVR